MNIILENFRFFMMGPFPNGPIGGLALTIYFGIYTGITSFLFGVIVATISLSPVAPVRLLARTITLVVRGVPSIVFLFWMYFLIPRLLGVNFSAFQSASIALAIYHGSYISEDIRGGFRAVATGQKEVGYATGLSPLQVLLHITYPQAIRAIMPLLVNRFVNLFMYTSIISLVGVLDFMRVAVIINNREFFYPIQIFAFVGATYFIFAVTLAKIGRYLETKWQWAPKVKTTETAV